jgi:Spy/CpxP family protein refolding chaperone
MKRRFAGLAAFLLLGISACAQPEPGSGMMGGQEMMGPRDGMGPGMRGGGYGPGHGMGRGMMMGPGMMGPGMMGGYGMPSDLTLEQRTRMAEIQQELRRQQSGVMQSMHSMMGSADGAAAGGAFDEQAARKNYDAVAALHKQMFENSLEARKRIDALLTPQQREQLRRGAGGR